MTPTYGKEDAKIVIVGDATTYYDWNSNRPVTPVIWNMICGMLAQMGIRKSEVLYTPCYSEQKPFSGLTGKALAEDAQQYLLPLLKAHPRSLVICLGNSAICAVGVEKEPKNVNKHRGKRLQVPELPGVDVCASISPYLIVKDPDENEEDVYADFRFAKKLLDKDYQENVDVRIIELATPGMLSDFVNDYSHRHLDYDTETTGLDPYMDIIVTYGFYRGEVDPDGTHVGYYWAGYDKLKERYEKPVLEQFKEGFIELFNSQEEGRREIGVWNAPFDHWMNEECLGTTLPFPMHDGMLKKWVVNKYGDIKLKTNTRRYLGYSDYEKEVTEAVNAIASRRGKVMRKDNPENADDFALLEWYGVEPVLGTFSKKLGQSYKWPETSVLQKKAGAYAMLDYDLLVKYQVLDAVYTGKLNRTLDAIIQESEDLVMSNDLRHYICERLLRATQRGFPMNVPLNREFSERLGDIITTTTERIVQEVRTLAPDIENFNCNSGEHVRRVLFGNPQLIPYIDIDGIIETGVPVKTAKTKIGALHEDFYADMEDLKDAVKEGEYDYEFTKELLIKEFQRRFPKYKGEIPVTNKKVYCGGLYEPDPEAMTKTGLPGTGRKILENLYEEKPFDFLQYLLLRGKATKIKSTFVDGLYNKIDSNNVLHGKYKATGTKSGRVSSCVDADTLITTERGEVRIVDLIVGEDKVYTHKDNWKTVVDLIDKGPGMMVELKLKCGNTVLCTRSHRVEFRTREGRTWKEVGLLNEGDQITANWTVGIVESVTPIGVRNVWDITVADDHSYIGNGIVHHNSEPNMTNLVSAIKGQLVARPGYILCGYDLSQVEMRVAAALSGDGVLLNAIYSEDFHKTTAALIFSVAYEDVTKSQRQKAKILNFAVLYQAGPFTISKFLGITVEEAEELITMYLDRFEILKSWIAERIETAKEIGYYQTVFGTRQYLRNLHSTHIPTAKHAERVAVNGEVQGTAGELIFYFDKEISDRLNELGIENHLMNVTHDYVAYEIPIEYAHQEEVQEKDETTGEMVTIKVWRCPVFEQVASEVIHTPVPFPPLDNVRFEMDFHHDIVFYEEPNLMKALDPDYGTEKQLDAWHLLTRTADTPDEKEELDEFIEMEEVYYASREGVQ
jgi:DNA polymerase I-like protein with 3'-5' exonuclease and polymerase domains